jgi:hypothetical protein
MNKKQIFIDAFENYKLVKPPVRVKINGNFVKTCTGKAGWKTVAHAKSALKHHFDDKFGYDKMEAMFGRRDEQWGAFLEEMIRDGTLEFC